MEEDGALLYEYPPLEYVVYCEERARGVSREQHHTHALSVTADMLGCGQSCRPMGAGGGRDRGQASAQPRMARRRPASAGRVGGAHAVRRAEPPITELPCAFVPVDVGVGMV